MVRSAGLEPAAPWFEAKCSIQLSYERTDPIILHNGRMSGPGAGYRDTFNLSLNAFSSFFTFGIATAAIYGWPGFRAAKSWW
jgi:hypothetical protein